MSILFCDSPFRPNWTECLSGRVDKARYNLPGVGLSDPMLIFVRSGQLSDEEWKFLHRLSQRPGTPFCSVWKRGTQSQALGRSRGFATTIHLRANTEGLPIDLLLTSGEIQDSTAYGDLMGEHDVDRRAAGRSRLRHRRNPRRCASPRRKPRDPAQTEKSRAALCRSCRLCQAQPHQAAQEQPSHHHRIRSGTRGRAVLTLELRYVRMHYPPS
jgi:hypothetical protein